MGKQPYFQVIGIPPHHPPTNLIHPLHHTRKSSMLNMSLIKTPFNAILATGNNRNTVTIENIVALYDSSLLEDTRHHGRLSVRLSAVSEA